MKTNGLYMREQSARYNVSDKFSGKVKKVITTKIRIVGKQLLLPVNVRPLDIHKWSNQADTSVVDQHVDWTQALDQFPRAFPVSQITHMANNLRFLEYQHSLEVEHPSCLPIAMQYHILMSYKKK